jgi:hypothetical protein
MAELKNRPPPGPFRVDVTFIDGSKLSVIDKVDGPSALNKYMEHVSGIGARVGTTRQVKVMQVYDDGSEYVVQGWVFKGTGAFA